MPDALAIGLGVVGALGVGARCWEPTTTGGKAKPRPVSKLKYTGPDCGANAWGKPGLALMSGGVVELEWPAAANGEVVLAAPQEQEAHFDAPDTFRRHHPS